MTPEQIRVLHEIKKMKETEGWAHIARDYREKIALLQEKINQIGGNEVRYSESDLHKIEMNLLKEIMGYEEALVSSLRSQTLGEDLESF